MEKLLLLYYITNLSVIIGTFLLNIRNLKVSNIQKLIAIKEILGNETTLNGNDIRSVINVTVVHLHLCYN